MSTDLRFASVQLATGPESIMRRRAAPAASRSSCCTAGRTPGSRSAASCPFCRETSTSLVPDQRGFGDSDRPAGSYEIPQFAADAVALLDALAIERATIVGHSFGSLVYTLCRARLPRTRRAVVLIGTGAVGANAVTREVRGSLDDLHDPVSAAFARDFQSSTAFVPLPPDFFDRIVTESLKLPAELWRQVFDGILAYDDTATVAGMSPADTSAVGRTGCAVSQTRSGSPRGGNPAGAAARCIRTPATAPTGSGQNWSRPTFGHFSRDADRRWHPTAPPLVEAPRAHQRPA